MPRKTLPKTELKALGELIKRQREERMLTQAGLAEEIGVASNTVGRWERGESLPMYYAQQKLRKTLQISKEAFSIAVVKEPSGGEETAFIPPPIKRIYRGRRTGKFAPPAPGEQPRYDYDEEDYGAGKTSLTVNGYPLDFFNQHEMPPLSYRLDWGYIGPPAENLAASLLANYFGEPAIPGKKSPEDFQTVKYLFKFSDEVVHYLPYEEWEITSDEIGAWVVRETARMKLEEKKRKEKEEKKRFEKKKREE
jgi:transcriptional regulator with XRE-family HTH domain